MSKFGWSYPPGVTESMLPGNSREEQELEALIESLYEAIAPLRVFYKGESIADEIEDQVINALEHIVNNVYIKAREDAMAEISALEELRAKTEDRGRGP